MIMQEGISHAAQETFHLGQQLGAMLNAGDLVAFCGDLGAGKTCCIQGIAVGLGVADLSLVTSPTFTLIQEYQGRFPIYHFDVYRLTQEEDLYDLGYEEYFYGEGVTLVEWAERIPHFLPAEHLVIHLHIEANQTRRVQFHAYGAYYEDLLRNFTSFQALP